MKKFMPYLIIFVLGVIIGAVCRGGHFREATKMVQRDTVVRYDTVRYSRLELVRNPYELPKSVKTQYVYIPDTSAEYIYRDSIRYVTLPREYYHTRTDEAEIWHSGIDSTIDSLNVFTKTTSVTKVIQPVTKCNALSLGIEANYATIPCLPVQLEYAYYFKPWFNIYGYVEYEMLRKQWGIGIGTKIEIIW